MIGILNFVIRNIRRRKLRNWLTILGIVVGVIAIVSLISLSEGLKNAISDEFNSLGANKITVTSKYAGFAGSSSGNGLTDEDIKTINKISDIEFSSGSLNGYIETKYAQETIMVSYTSYDAKHFQEMLEQNNLEVEKGEYITDEKIKAAVIGYNYTDTEKSKDLFGKTIDIGKKIKIAESDYTVIGILKKTGDSRKDNLMYLSNDNLKEITESETYDTIFAIVKPGKNIDNAANRIKIKLEKARDAKDVTVTSPIQEAKNREETLGIVTIVVVGIACISLLVGGIGILNSMYTSVFERKKEIGVLKAIGAKKRDILMIFLLESGIIGLLGGTIGVILGFSLAGLVKLVAYQVGITISISITASIIILALSFSFMIGVISGMIPAYLASNQEPVDALREE
jgi:putative ABC transport system permease protein